VEEDLNQLLASLREATTSLERSTTAYVDGLKDRLNRRTQIDRLILHVRQNIFHYMQAIWSLEHKDARYLRLYNLEIQWPGPAGAVVQQAGAAVRTADWNPPNNDPGPGAYTRVDPPEFTETRFLHQVADLSRPLGFRGNLAIFPLHTPNALTTYMVQDFLDSHFGVSDPDPLGAAPTPTEALELAKCMWASNDLSDADRGEIADWLVRVFDGADASSHEIVTPTGELFIEALTGSHSLLEDFKLRHRAYDAELARTQALAAEIEALRRLMRLEMGDTADPDVDHVVNIDGSAAPVVPVGGDNE
jgi:hypothetical protein